MVKKILTSTKKSEVSATSYAKFITSLKTKIRSVQIKGAVAVNFPFSSPKN